MNDIDLLEHGGAGEQPFMIRLQGQLHDLMDPRSENFQMVLAALSVEHVPGTPPMPEWQRELVFRRWRAAWNLPTFREAQRLAYLVDHYRAAISNDLAVYTHFDLGELWRARRWILLLDIIDRLPAHSWYASTVSMDEDHARMMAESIAARQADGDTTKPSGPSLVGWTPEVAATTNVLDAVRHVAWAVFAAQAGQKAGEPPKPAPRPVTPLERALKVAENNRRQKAHEALVARVIRRAPEPDAAPSPEPPRGPTPADVARILARNGDVKG